MRADIVGVIPSFMALSASQIFYPSGITFSFGAFFLVVFLFFSSHTFCHGAQLFVYADCTGLCAGRVLLYSFVLVFFETVPIPCLEF